MERLPETCSEILAKLPLFAGYDLEAPEMEAVAEHLERCEDCRRACDRAKRAREVLGSLREPESSRSSGPDLWVGVRSRLVDEGLLETGPRVARPFASPRWWVGSAAAAALLLAVGLIVLRDDPTGSGVVLPVQPAPTSLADAAQESATPGMPGAPASSGELAEEIAGGAVPRPMRGDLVGQGELGAVDGAGSQAARQATIAPEGSSGRALRRLEPGELGLYEQALRESARLVPVQVRTRGDSNPQKRLLGIR